MSSFPHPASHVSTPRQSCAALHRTADTPGCCPLVRNDPSVYPASPPSPPLALLGLEVPAGFPAPQDCQTRQPTLVAGAWLKTKVPTKELDSTGLETALWKWSCTCRELFFRMGKNKSLRELGPSVKTPDKLLWVQTDHFSTFRSLFGSFQGQFLEVSYSQIIVARKKFSIEIRTLYLRKPIQFLPNPQPIILWEAFWFQIHFSKDKKWKWQATMIITYLIICNKWE